MGTGSSADVFSSRRMDQLGYPMSGEVQRVQPFDAENATPGSKPRVIESILGEPPQLQFQALNQFFGGFDPSYRVSNRPDVFQNSANIASSKRNNPRLRVHRIRKSVNFTVSNRTDLAQVLGEDQIGSQGLQHSCFEPYHWLPFGLYLTNLGVDTRAGEGGIHRGPGDPR